MKEKPDCPVKNNCKNWEKYPTCAECFHRKRRADGLFECLGFKETKIVELDKLQPTIELFEEYQ